MKYRTLGRTGLNVSAIGFGGIPLQAVSEKKAKSILREAFKLGINFFDSSHASSYGDSETKFGKFLSKKAIIATKSKRRTPKEIEEDLEGSLEALQRSHIDIYQNHCVDDLGTLNYLITNGSLDFLNKSKKQGKMSYLGISTHREDVALRAIELNKWDVIMYPFNPIKKQNLNIVLEAQKKNIGFVTMKPLDGGNILNPDLSLRWILGYPVSTVIPGMISLEQVNQNVDSVYKGGLSKSEEKILMKSVENLEGMCQSCGYCEPGCPEQVPLKTILYLHNYAMHMKLPRQALERFEISMKGKNNPYNCIECGNCKEECPNKLDVPEKLKQAREYFKNKLGEKKFENLFS